MKKVRIFFLAAFSAALMIACAVIASASGIASPTVRVESKTAAAGETVEIALSIENNPGILCATISLSFDEELTLINASAGDAFAALAMTPAGQFTSPCKFSWDGIELSAGDIKDGTILRLTFLVSEQAATDDILNVSASYKTGAVTDSNLMPVDLTIVNGGVAVANPNISPVTEVVGLIEDGKITITLTSTEAVDDAQLFVASYAESGALLGISMESIALISGTKDYFPQNIATGKQYRAFLFNGDMQPYCPVINVQKPPEKFTVRFLDYDNRLISEQTVIEGQSAAAPAAPKRDGYTFVGWSGSYTNVQSDTTVVAQYEEITGPLLVVGTVTARPGDTEVELTVSVRNNPGIMCMALSVGFDDTALTLTGASSGAAVNDVLTMTASPLGNGCKFAWDGESISASQIKDGVVLNMKFSVAANAAAKEYPITVSYQGGAITDGNLQPVMPLINNGKIIVTSQG